MVDGEDGVQPGRAWGGWAVRVGFLLLLAGSVAGMWALRKDHAKRVQAWEDSAAQRRAESYELYRRIQKLARERESTRQRVETEMALPLVEAGRKGRKTVYSMTDPKSGSEFGLTFIDERLQPYPQLILAPRPARYKVHATLEEGRRLVLSWGGLIWLAVAAQLLTLPRWRRPIADGALAIAMMVVAAVALHEGTRLGLYIGGVHWSVLLACAIGPVSLLAAWLVRIERSPEPLCRKCGYNLLNNTSGVCPECGWVLSLSMRERVSIASRPKETVVPDLDNVREEESEPAEEDVPAVTTDPPADAAPADEPETRR